MLKFSGFQADRNSQVINSEINYGDKRIVRVRGEEERKLLIAIFKGEKEPFMGYFSVQKPEELAVSDGNSNVSEDQPIKRIFLSRVEKLLKSLRKYEQLSIKMAKHFSPSQLGGLMEEMEEMEEFIENHQAWELEHTIKEWQENLNLPELSLPFGEVDRYSQKRTELASLMIFPPECLIMEDPFLYLNQEQSRFFQEKLRNGNFTCLLVADLDSDIPVNFKSMQENGLK